MGARIRPALLLSTLCAAACTMQGTDIPSLTGPSELALSVTVSATPDSISWDGYSQSSVIVSAKGPDGQPKAGVAFRLDMKRGEVVQDYGTLNLRTVVTGADGRASAIYTSPPQPSSASGASFEIVTIQATSVGSNFQTAVSQGTEVRLVKPGVILPPANAPTANFTFSPSAPTNSTRIFFNASTSCNGSTPCSTAGLTFEWAFGDGTFGSGMTPSKVYDFPATYSVTLEVTNDRGLKAQTTKAVSVSGEALPVASFVFSPTAPAVGSSIQFDASQSIAQSGRTLVSYSWNWGDSSPSSTGVTTTHTFSTAGIYNVVLTVTDNVGQTGTSVRQVSVGSGAPTAAFTAVAAAGSPPGHTMVLNASASSALGGATITNFTWSFDDGSPSTTGQVVNYTFSSGGQKVITLTVTDSLGRTGTASQSVTVP